jgi:hypothetical protein
MEGLCTFRNQSKLVLLLMISFVTISRDMHVFIPLKVHKHEIILKFFFT